MGWLQPTKAIFSSPRCQAVLDIGYRNDNENTIRN